MTSELNPALAPLISSLQTRLVETGEWSKMLNQLASQLDDSQWMQDLKQHARDQLAETQGELSEKQLVSSIQTFGEASIPQDTKDGLLANLRAFVDKNVE